AVASRRGQALTADDPRQEPGDVLRVVERAVVGALEPQPAEVQRLRHAVALTSPLRGGELAAAGENGDPREQARREATCRSRCPRNLTTQRPRWPHDSCTESLRKQGSAPTGVRSTADPGRGGGQGA